jgi:hypothetical protein
LVEWRRAYVPQEELKIADYNHFRGDLQYLKPERKLFRNKDRYLQVEQQKGSNVCFTNKILWKFSDEEIIQHARERFGAILLDLKPDEPKLLHKNNDNFQQYNNFILPEESKREYPQFSLMRRIKEEETIKMDCSICLDDLFSKAYIGFRNCNHLYHQECIEKYVVGKIKERSFPIRCPNEKCKKEMAEDDVKDSIQTPSLLKYQQYYVQYSFNSYIGKHSNEYLCCLTPDCRGVYWLEDDTSEFTCTICDKSYCLRCKTEWHEGVTCEEFIEQKIDAPFFKLAEKRGLQKCPSCGYYVEKDEGCNHMVCNCGEEFCYKCGEIWGSQCDGNCKTLQRYRRYYD